MILFSSVFLNVAYGSIYLDQEVYTWTDKINIRITEHGLDSSSSTVRIYTSDHELDNYKLSKAGNGLYTGEVILTGFLHDVNGDGKPDTSPRTVGSGPNNGFLETKRDGGFTISVEFGDGDVITKSAKISWNKGNIAFDMSNYTPNESAKIQVTDVDMNLNPETLDTIQVHVFSDSDKAGILVNAIENPEESGLFETIFSFTQDSASSGNRLFAISGDAIYAQYDDYTLPAPYGINDNLEIITESTINFDSLIPEPEQSYSNIDENNPCGLGTTYQDGICVVDKTEEKSVKSSSNKREDAYLLVGFESPLKQFKSGIEIDDIQCKESLTLLTKHDGSPACVKPETAEKLIQRGWIDSPVKLSTLIKQIKTISSDPVLAKKITKSNNQFTIDFYKQVSKEKNENIFFSSPSMSTAFSILYEGAKGDTATEIQDVFGFPTDDNERQIGFISFINMMNQKNNDENTIQISNALWLANDFTPLPEYINTAETYYDSSIDTVNFATDEGRLEINDWVKSKTQDRIEELLVPGSTTSSTKMVITNTIYFKGLWEYPFELENTYDGDFVVDSTKTVTVPIMTFDHKMNLNHTSTDQMQMLQMPYMGNSFSMLIILPHDAQNIQSVEDSLTLDNLELWKSQLVDLRGINIHIPKFTLDTEYNLKKMLPDMGLSLVFGPADLSGINGHKGLFVSEAVHKAFVEVNELGTEAAAATAINLNESGGQLFKADHPFIFLIQDNIRNDILFIGKIVDPTK